MRYMRGIDAEGNGVEKLHVDRRNGMGSRGAGANDAAAAAILGTHGTRGPRVRRRTTSFTDGPFIETKELLG